MFEYTAMLGLIAFRDDWIDLLYVLPHAQGRGIGTEFLKVAQKSFARLQLWTFQRNLQARCLLCTSGWGRDLTRQECQPQPSVSILP